MELSEYRKQIEAEIAEAEAAAAARRQEAPARTAKGRAEQMAGMELTSENLDDSLPFLLDLLGKSSEPVTVRAMAMDMITTAEFLGPAFYPHRPAVTEAMRRLASDKSPALQEKALQYLAQRGDGHARRILTAAIETPETAPVSQAKAIQLLGLDDHANAAALVRTRFDSLPQDAREEAAHVLATDPGAAETLSRVMADRSEAARLRQISAAGLHGIDPHRFAQTARGVLHDTGDSADLKTAIVMLAESPAALTEGPVPDLTDAIEAARKATRSKTLRQAADRFLATRRGE